MGTFLLKNTSNDSIEIDGINYLGYTYFRDMRSFHAIIPPNKSIPISWYSNYSFFLHKNDLKSFCEAYKKGWFNIYFSYRIIVDGVRHYCKHHFIPQRDELRYAPVNASCFNFISDTIFNQPVAAYELLDYYVYLNKDKIENLRGFIRLENSGESTFRPINVKCVLNTTNEFNIAIRHNSGYDNDIDTYSQVKKGQGILLNYSFFFKENQLSITEFISQNRKIPIQIEYEGGFIDRFDIIFSKDRLIKLID